MAALRAAPARMRHAMLRSFALCKLRAAWRILKQQLEMK